MFSNCGVRNIGRNGLKCSRRSRNLGIARNSLARVESTASEQAKQLPLTNLKVLDLSRVLAGPFCTQILSDYGAEVLKIEQPALGDETRQWRTQGETDQMWKASHPLMSLYFCAINRNKRSLTVDLKRKEGQKIIHRLLEQGGYDVVVHNFVPGKMETFGLGYEQLKKMNPGLIYAEISGYGATGPKQEKTGYDAIALAEAGLLHITGDSHGPPIKPGVAIADLSTGLYAHGAVLAAVNARNQTGVGMKIEGSLLESSLSLLINVGLASLNLDLDKGSDGRRKGRRFGAGHPNLVPYNRYQTRDGRWLFVAANNDRQFKLFCKKLEIVGLADEFASNDDRVENRARIDSVLSSKFAQKTLEDWLRVFEGSGLPYGPINDVVDALENEQTRARDMLYEVDEVEAAKDGILRMIGPAMKMQGCDMTIRRKPPLLGEHNDEVLLDLDYSPQDIIYLKQEGIV